MNKRMVAAQAAYIIPYDACGQILVGRRSNTGYMDGIWQVFAGHVEMDELPSEALIREAKEELGIRLYRKYCELVHVSNRPRHDDTGNRVDYYFKVNRWDGDVRNVEWQKCDAMKWVHPDRLPKPFTPHVAHALKCIREGITYSELSLSWMKQQPLYGIK